MQPEAESLCEVLSTGEDGGYRSLIRILTIVAVLTIWCATTRRQCGSGNGVVVVCSRKMYPPPSNNGHCGELNVRK